MFFNKTKTSISKTSDALNFQEIKKSKSKKINKKKTILKIRAKRKVVAKKIRIEKKNLKKAQDNKIMNINQINVELKINKSTFQALNDEKNTFMSKKINNVIFINNISDVIITYF